MVILEARDLTYHYTQADKIIPILKGIHFQLYRGQRVALIGSSGVGKSTFLHLLGLLDTAQSGEIMIRDAHRSIETTKLIDAQRAALRGNAIGFIYQFHHLLNEFTALENVMVPQLIARKPMPLAKKRAIELLEKVSLQDRLHHRPSQLSGGQQQRVAIARALANEPKILLADEPTGNLDEHTANEIFQLFLTLSQSYGLSVVMATHNIALRQYFDRVVTLHDGHLHELEEESLLSARITETL